MLSWRRARGKTLCRGGPGWNAPRWGIANPRAESSPSPGVLSAKQIFICNPPSIVRLKLLGVIQQLSCTKAHRVLRSANDPLPQTCILQYSTCFS